jgi:hypothetical protein
LLFPSDLVSFFSADVAPRQQSEIADEKEGPDKCVPLLFELFKMAISSKSVLVVFALCAVVCAVAGASPPQFPHAYKTGLAQLVEMLPGHNVTWRNGQALFNRQLQAAKLSGTTGGMALTNLDLFSQATRYVIDNRYCQKERLTQAYSDPLDLIKYTSYAGVASINGKSVQLWSYTQGNFVNINIYTTNDANHFPVRLFFLQSGAGVLIDYSSFSAGTSASDFQPPSTCSGGHPMGETEEIPSSPLQPIFDFLHATPVALN